MTCTDCQKAATTWNWHGYRNNCPDCEIRAIAQTHREARELRYTQIERSAGAAAAQEVRRRVSEEYQRIKALKGSA